MRSKTKFNKKRFNSKKRINKNVRKGSRKRINGGSNKSLRKLKRRKVNSRKQRGGRCSWGGKAKCNNLIQKLNSHLYASASKYGGELTTPQLTELEELTSVLVALEDGTFRGKLDQLLTSWITELLKLMETPEDKDKISAKIFNFVNTVADDTDIIKKCNSKKNMKKNRHEMCSDADLRYYISQLAELDVNDVVNLIKTALNIYGPSVETIKYAADGEVFIPEGDGVGGNGDAAGTVGAWGAMSTAEPEYHPVSALGNGEVVTYAIPNEYSVSATDVGVINHGFNEDDGAAAGHQIGHDYRLLENVYIPITAGTAGTTGAATTTGTAATSDATGNAGNAGTANGNAGTPLSCDQLRSTGMLCEKRPDCNVVDGKCVSNVTNSAAAAAAGTTAAVNAYDAATGDTGADTGTFINHPSHIYAYGKVEKDCNQFNHLNCPIDHGCVLNATNVCVGPTYRPIYAEIKDELDDKIKIFFHGNLKQFYHGKFKVNRNQQHKFIKTLNEFMQSNIKGSYFFIRYNNTLMIIWKGTGKNHKRMSLSIPTGDETEFKWTNNKQEIKYTKATEWLDDLKLKYPANIMDDPCCGINNIIKPFEFKSD
jgi:hypothetical protein